MSERRCSNTIKMDRNLVTFYSVISLYPKESSIRIAKWFDSEFSKITEKGKRPLLRWADIKKASTWMTNHASDVHAVGLSSRRIANLIKNFDNLQILDRKTAKNSRQELGSDGL